MSTPTTHNDGDGKLTASRKMLDYGKLRAVLPIVFLASLSSCLMNPAALGQTPKPPIFDAATIKPPDPMVPDRISGFYGYPGGRVFFGGPIKSLVEYAFNLHDYQLTGGPNWLASQWFEINAVPPEDSPSRNITQPGADPTAEQRLMLQSLLRDRFGFKCHFEEKKGEIYILSRGSSPLQLKRPKDPAADPRAIFSSKQDGVWDGEAEGTNTTIDYLAFRLSRYLELPVLNQTGIVGSYDYYLPPYESENNDRVAAVLSTVNRLGLKIKHGRGPIQHLVIDHVEMPSEN
jgi:uncharacterized protein (TIGR03435 family)